MQCRDGQHGHEHVALAKASEQQCHDKDDDQDDEAAWGDVNDCQLDPAKVRRARAAEMTFSKKMQVYDKVPWQRCRDATGCEPIKVRGADTSKQDDAKPKYRSRLAAEGYKKGSDPELYTATPPIDALRLLISLAATGYTSRGGGGGGAGDGS